MRLKRTTSAVAVMFAVCSTFGAVVSAKSSNPPASNPGNAIKVQLGPRPYYLVDKMTEGTLKDDLQQCSEGPFTKRDFSIGHRGAALQFPEHTKESYEAAARMGAGILECDVTFTSDGKLVCRHAECDLHTTTNILDTPLASTCEQEFTPAEFDADGNRISPATARCCTSDITLAQFKSLCGKMDASNPNATTVVEFLGGTANYRTDLYATCGTVLSHKESIELFDGLGRKFTPELKSGNPANINAIFGSQAAYAQAMIDAYKDAGINPKNVYAQSFNLDDVVYWLENEPAFGEQAVYLISDVADGQPLTGNPSDINQNPPDQADFDDVKGMGVNIVAPPMPTLLTHINGAIVPSEWAQRAMAAGFDIISWTTERSGRIVEDVIIGGNTFYYQTTLPAIANDGDILTTIDVLAQQVGIIGLFSDWPATTTYYANCKGLK